MYLAGKNKFSFIVHSHETQCACPCWLCTQCKCISTARLLFQNYDVVVALTTVDSVCVVAQSPGVDTVHGADGYWLKRPKWQHSPKEKTVLFPWYCMYKAQVDELVAPHQTPRTDAQNNSIMFLFGLPACPKYFIITSLIDFLLPLLNY